MLSQPAKPSGTMPADVTTFVGRRHDLAGVRQLLTVSRIVTLTGIGGVGKTRLAVQAAKEMHRAFPDGTYVVELAFLSEPDLLAQTVIDALDVPETPSIDPLTALGRYLRDMRMLLILDNCEQLVAATAVLVDHVLRAAPGVKILATSRQALMIAGEHLYPVHPLLSPDPGSSWEPGTAKHYPSVALFADRSAAVVPGFDITPDNEQDVVRLCQRLEGIPLAIELAAVRLRVLTVQQLADGLDDRFQLLREGTRNLPERHQSLRSLIDWSFDLCTSLEQLLWARASVFADGFTGEAARAVCSGDGLPAEEVLDAIAGLVDKSILLREEHGQLTRFRMLETIREYGEGRLREHGLVETLQRRHRDWYLEFVDRATREWVGPRQMEWGTQVQQEHANLRAALEYCMRHPADVDLGLRIASQPWFWAMMDHITEAALWLDRGLAADPTPSGPRAWALATRAYIAVFQGDHAKVATLPEQAHAMAVEFGFEPAVALSNHVLGFRLAMRRDGDLRRAIALFEEALSLYARTDVPVQYKDFVVVELAVAYLLLDDVDRAAEYAEDLYQRCQAVGDRWNLAYALWLRGMIALIHDDPEGAERHLLEALRIKRQFRDTLGLALTLEVTGWVAAARGEAERSAIILGGTDRVWRALGARQLHDWRARYEPRSRKSLGDAAYDAAVQRGGELTVGETLAFGLRESEKPVTPTTSDQRLTPREREVAGLVADGMSNKQIAEKLVISARTAEGHVENILSKMGFNTRTQIASWITHQRGTRGASAAH